MTLLFEQPPRFEGLPEEGFDVFSIEDRDARREAILETIHPALGALGEDLVRRYSPDEELPDGGSKPFHAHLPRLDWPRGYEPFCTWLVVSRDAHGYQKGPQLNLGVHADFVTARLGWDTDADFFGRFEFLCRRGHLEEELARLAAEADLAIRVYAPAGWPEGSRRIFESRMDVEGSFDAVHQGGVWWEIGRRYLLDQQRELVVSAEFGAEVGRVFDLLVPLYDRLTGDSHAGQDGPS